MKDLGFVRINNHEYSSGNYLQLLNALGKESWVYSIVSFLEDWFSDREYVEAQTSGSTGEPKTIRLQKESMVNSARMTCRFFGLTDESSALLCLPADYIAGKMMLVRAMVSGLNLLVARPSSDPFSNVQSIVDFSAITPYQFLNSYQSLQEIPVKTIIVGGSSVSLHLQKIMESLETEFYETYGMTETCSHIALRKLNGEMASEYFEILPGVSIRQDDRNCLVIEVPDLVEKELVTNDVVTIIDKTHFKWLGRYDNVINSGGIKVFPEQIEKKLEPFIDRRFFIGALHDEALGQKVIMVIEGDAFSDKEEQDLNGILSSCLNKYEKPRQIIYRPEFEVSSSGKILKRQIVSSL